jgi:hypothetical protein
MAVGPCGTPGVHAVQLADMEHKLDLGTAPIHGHQTEAHFVLEVAQKTIHAVCQKLAELVNSETYLPEIWCQFTNILFAPFSYERFARSFFVLTF